MYSSNTYSFPQFTKGELRNCYSTAAHGSFFVLAFGAAVMLGGGVYGLLVLGAACGLITFSNQPAGLWLSLALVMLASFLATPVGFEFGYGYSPELAYWAVATCFPLVALSITFVGKTINYTRKLSVDCVAPPPAAFYVFALLSVYSAALGLVRGYPFLDVAKQYYGCLLFCAYFLCTMAFAHNRQSIEGIFYHTTRTGIVCALVYIVIYLSRVPSVGFRKELTVLAGYAGGLAVLALPGLIGTHKVLQRLNSALPIFILCAVPVLAQYKRAILAFIICAFLCVGLRSTSRGMRYLYIAIAFLVFTIVLSTNLLNPIGAYFSNYESLRMLFPVDIQSSYSVYLRVEELRQVVRSLGGVPMFGTGMGSTLVWYDPYSQLWLQQQTMASGWGYLIVKMGIVGTLVFVWFAVVIIRDSLVQPLTGVHLGMFLLFLFQLLQMVADPFFLNFMTSLWAGMTCASLWVMNTEAAQKEQPQ